MTPSSPAATRKGDARGGAQAATAAGTATRAVSPAGSAPRRSGGPGSATSSGRSRSAAGRSRSAAGRSRSGAGRRPAGSADGRRSSRPAAGRPAALVVPAGLAWAAALVAGVGLGTAATVVVAVPVAVVAAASGVRSAAGTLGGGDRSGTSRNRPSARKASGSGARRGRTAARTVVALAGSAVVPLAALGGPVPATGALAVLILLTLALSGPASTAGALQGRLGMLVVGIGPAVAAMSLVLARRQGSNEALALVAAVLAYDVGAFMMGNARSATGGRVGVVSGLASVLVVAVFVAAVMNPPFGGARPWTVFSMVAVLAAGGVWLGDVAVAGARLPALRRLDSLMLAAPAWVMAMAVIGHH